jgi:hypothetical protein
MGFPPPCHLPTPRNHPETPLTTPLTAYANSGRGNFTTLGLKSTKIPSPATRPSTQPTPWRFLLPPPKPPPPSNNIEYQVRRSPPEGLRLALGIRNQVRFILFLRSFHIKYSPTHCIFTGIFQFHMKYGHHRQNHHLPTTTSNTKCVEAPRRGFDLHLVFATRYVLFVLLAFHMKILTNLHAFFRFHMKYGHKVSPSPFIMHLISYEIISQMK